MTTQAQKISQKLSLLVDGGGYRWTTDDDQDFEELLEERSESKDQDWDRESTKYIFADGSSIVACGPVWDFGIDGADCHCWAGDGHTQGCAEVQ